MIEILNDLPKFPRDSDVWHLMKNSEKPVVIYGMGNGADKLINYGEKYGIKFSDIFASDGFVRGHSFRGMLVKSFSEIKKTYPDFLIALSFASSRPEVLSMIEDISSSFDLVAPDMPVAGDEYFTSAFYNAHFDEISAVYDILEDEESKRIFSSVLHYKLSGNVSYLLDNYSEKKDIYSLLPKDVEVIADLGAYNGDTVREAKQYIRSLKRAYAVEPDVRNFKKLVKYAEEEKDIELNVINAAAWSCIAEGDFSGSGNRNSSINATASYKNREENVKLLPLSEIVNDKIDYIKYDVEGAEKEALLGSEDLIKKYSPSLLVSLYHRSEDIFALPLLVKKLNKDYKLYIRRTRCLPAWEIALVCVK